MSSGTGSVVIDFGAWPGSNEAQVAVTGQAEILATDHAEAWFMADATGDHTAADHAYVACLASLTCGTPTAAAGFTIFARSEHKLQGTFNVHYVWAS